ncbi:MAG: GDP-L-fucose synthase [Bdellovibrionota bacterium]
MKILITGGTGMVGKNLLEHPKTKELKVIAPTRQQMNLFDYDHVKNYLIETKPDLIVHAAGRVGGIQANIKNPVSFLVENTDINRNLIMAAYEAKIPSLLNLASSCMYPKNASNPLREEQILTGELEPTNEGYALAKILGLKLCQYIRNQHPDFQYKTLIPCNLYGRHDKFNPEHSHLVPAIIHKTHLAKTNKTSIEIWGDGLARREFMDAADLADAIFYLAPMIKKIPDVMNIGLGHDHSVNDYYQAAGKVIGYTGDFQHDLTKPTGMKQKLISIEKIASLGWKSKTSLEQGIKKTYDYYLQNGVSK